MSGDRSLIEYKLPPKPIRFALPVITETPYPVTKP